MAVNIHLNEGNSRKPQWSFCHSNIALFSRLAVWGNCKMKMMLRSRAEPGNFYKGDQNLDGVLNLK
uniref:Uncharacterized protein n=1 Tax=Nelumbo nucifera TaxID=4432 RepID=A0A822XGZ0_NELNU|nr:TPA_asm: hypothetical protein HUJ06_022217 [Nelumbo nucifera]